MSLNLDPDRDELNESICSIPRGDLPILNELPPSYVLLRKNQNELSKIER